jgi:hypothetical protein
MANSDLPPLLACDDLALPLSSPIRLAIESPLGRAKNGDLIAAARLLDDAGYEEHQIFGLLANPANAVHAYAATCRNPLVAVAEVIKSVCADGRSANDDGPNAVPVDLWARHEPRDLPSGLLPSVIEDFAMAQGRLMGVDTGGLAMAALAVCAATIPDSIQLQVKQHDQEWKESARLWVALVGLPSAKKSPIMRAVLRPLNKIDARLFGEYSTALKAYEALPKAERASAPKPQQRRLCVSDATIEALQEVLKDSPDGILSEQDELSGWFGQMDKYGAGKGAMADRSFWLKAFNGGQGSVNRISRGSTIIPNLSINVLGGIQPEPLRKIVNDAVDDGLIQRLLPVILRSADVGIDAPQSDELAKYDAMVAKLWELKPPKNAGQGNLSEFAERQTLKFSTEAQKIRTEMEAYFHKLMQVETVSPKMASHFGKYDGIYARLCVIWHCVHNCNEPNLPQIVEASTAQKVARFLQEYIKPNAIAFYTGVLGLSDDHDDLIEIASYILAKKLETVQARDIQRGGNRMRALKSDESRTLLEKLEFFGWLNPAPSPTKSRSPHWRVVPDVHVRFAERGRAEAERRKKAQEAILEALGQRDAA